MIETDIKPRKSPQAVQASSIMFIAPPDGLHMKISLFHKTLAAIWAADTALFTCGPATVGTSSWKAGSVMLRRYLFD